MPCDPHHRLTDSLNTSLFWPINHATTKGSRELEQNCNFPNLQTLLVAKSIDQHLLVGVKSNQRMIYFVYLQPVLDRLFSISFKHATGYSRLARARNTQDCHNQFKSSLVSTDSRRNGNSGCIFQRNSRCFRQFFCSHFWTNKSYLIAMARIHKQVLFVANQAFPSTIELRCHISAGWKKRPFRLLDASTPFMRAKRTESIYRLTEDVHSTI
jgi:hypothetical protein